MNHSPRYAGISTSVLRCTAVFLLGVALVAAQSRIIKPPAQTNPGGAGKRQHVATLRSTDSPEGSRVALSSDQSLNDYEAYRRGDRFYVKIPAADVPRAETVRGRGFADVKAQRSGDSTIVSFRLQPGATAHVEPRSNRLDIVISVPGARAADVASNRTRDVARPGASAETGSRRAGSANQSGPSPSNSAKSSSALANKNAADRSTAPGLRGSGPAASSNSNSGSKSEAPAASVNSSSKPSPTPASSPRPSPTVKAATPTPQNSSALTAQSPASQSTTAPSSRQDTWGRMKERINYWILLAQLNPVPVAIGAGILILLIALFLFQRRRAKATRHVRPSPTKASAKDIAPEAKAAAELKKEAVDPSVAATGVAAATSPKEEAREVAPVVIPAAQQSPVDDARRERVAQVSEQARNVLAGNNYDESLIGSDDRETRQLVGAELLSAIVGRNLPRRERAREAFMKHGYFDDATRDLRIADSANERAAAARRLSFVHDREATPHLIGALDDPSPDVRRAAVEALMDLRDPAAIGPLNSLMQTETDRKVPRTLIKQAIEACATSAPDESFPPPTAIAGPSSQPIESEREVIEL